MKIAIIGSGNVGAALAEGWHNYGHEVVFGVRDPGSVKSKSATEGLAAIPLRGIADAAMKSDVIVIATPPEAVPAIAVQLGDAEEKVIIDASNAIRTKPEGYATAFHALIALTNSKHVVKCFNSTGFENMRNPVYQLSKPFYGDAHLDMFMAGDSAYAKQVCTELAKNLGFENCYDFGGAARVELLEQFALAWINLAMIQGMGRNIAFKLIKRELKI